MGLGHVGVAQLDATAVSQGAFLHYLVGTKTTLMKTLFSLFTACALSSALFAQTSLTTAVDFTVTDLDGNEHTLSEYLDADKYVCIDFFAYWCGPCAAHAPYFTEVYHMFGCNAGDVIFLSMEYEGTTEQTHDFEVANAGENPAPAISGQDGGGLQVHNDYAIQAYPTFILIDPEWNIVEQDIWPMDVSILDGVLQSYGLQQMECSTSDVALKEDVAIAAYPVPADHSLNVDAPAGAELVLFDMVGREALAIQATSGRTVLNVSELAEGSYLLRSTFEGHVTTQKVAIRH